MTPEGRTLLAFGPPVVVERPTQRQRDLPRLSKPSGGRQGERLAPQFRELAAAFDAERARLAADTPDEVDPALVVVFDLAGSVRDFRNAVDRIDGLEFLSEMLGDQADPDDDFHMAERVAGRTDKPVPHSLYLVMSNAKAIDELLRLFAVWQKDPSASFAEGLGRFKAAFQQLTAIRRWGPEDRIREPACERGGRKPSVSSASPSAPSRLKSSCGTDVMAHSAPQPNRTSRRSSRPVAGTSSTVPRLATSATTPCWQNCRFSRSTQSSTTVRRRSACSPPRTSCSSARSPR